MFIDEVEITIKAGDGGDGVVSFRREKYAPRGGPDGGNGGDGGDVYLEGVSDLAALRYFRQRKHFEAEAGKRGMKSNKSGEAGNHLVLKVPVGTVATDLYTTERVEILKSGDRVHIALGGKGGRGNTYFKSSINRTPRQFERGGHGQRKDLKLELELIADVGLIGLPNAGKSSLLNALTRAKAQVANYPFTTLEPNLGVLHTIVLADIPGLIEGAAKGKGLGIAFLRHVRRTKILAHCISIESNDVEGDYTVIRRELAAFDQHMTEKPELIILTKIDLAEAGEIDKKTAQLNKKFSNTVLPCSIHQPESLKKFESTLATMLRDFA